MVKNAVVVVVFLWSLHGAAQTPSAPPLPPSPPAGECATNRDCGSGRQCVGFQELAPGQWSRGYCVVSPPRPRRAERLPYDGTVPPGYELKEGTNGLLIGVGLGFVAAGTASSVFWAAILRNPVALIPVGGAPAAVLSLPPNTVSGAAIAVIGGVAQGAGIGLFIAGLLLPRRWLEPAPLTISPTVNGAMISGSF